MNYDSETIKRFLISAALDETEMVCDYVESFGIFPDATWGGKPTALCYASLRSNIWLVVFLLDRGADAGHRDALDMTPLHYATMGGCSICIRALLAAGADPRVRNRFGKTADTLIPERVKGLRRRDILKALLPEPKAGCGNRLRTGLEAIQEGIGGGNQAKFPM